MAIDQVLPNSRPVTVHLRVHPSSLPPPIARSHASRAAGRRATTTPGRGVGGRGGGKGWGGGGGGVLLTMGEGLH